MKNNFITKIIGATLAFAMMVGGAVGINAAKEAKMVDATIDTANGYSAATMTGGTNGGGAVVTVGENGCVAVKVGTSSKGGDLTVTIPSGTTNLRFYAAAWKGVTGLSLNITKVSGAAGATISDDSVALTADDGIANSSPFTLKGSENDFRFDLTLSGITAETVYKFATSTTKRFVMWSAQTKASQTPDPVEDSITSVSLDKGELNLDIYSSASGSLTANVSKTGNPSIALTAESDNEAVATISTASPASGVPFTVTALAEGEATITVTSVADNTKFATCTVNVTDSTPAPFVAKEYALCTSTNDLEAGASYLITSGTSGTVKTMSNASNNNNRPAIDITVSNSRITSIENVLTLTLGGEPGAWTLQTENYEATDGYLASATSGNNNYCRVINDETTGTISFENNKVVINLEPHSSRTLLRYNPNNGNPIFACYSSGQNDIYLWKEYKELDHLDVSGELAKTAYYESETFDSTGLTISAVYTNSSSRVLPTNAIDWPDLEAGMTQIRGSYTENNVTKYTQYFNITVSEDTLSTITLSGNITATYFTTDNWDKGSLVVTANYASGYNNNVTNEATIVYYSDSAMQNEVATPGDLGPGANQQIYVKATYEGVSNTTGYAQTVTVTVEHGSVSNDPLTVAEAVEMVSEYAHNTQTTRQYYISGVVSQIVEADNKLGETENYATFYLQNGDVAQGMEIYRITPAAGCTNYSDFKVGAEVLIKCQIRKYSSQTQAGTARSLISISYTAPTLSGISLNKTSLDLTFGESDNLVATPAPLGAEMGEVSWSSSNTKVATVNQSGLVTAVGEGSAVITVRFGDITNTCNVTVAAIAANKVFKATSISVGDVVILAAEKGSAKDQLASVETIGNVTSYATTPNTSTAPLTVEAGSKENTFALKLGTQYLNWSSGNSLSLSDEISDNSSWTITFNNTTATIKNVKDSTRILQYNSSSPRFACYATSQTLVTLWKTASIDSHLSAVTSYAILQGNETNEGVDSVSIRFGARIPEEEWNNINADWQITDYGIMVKQKAKLGAYESITEAYNAGDRSFTTVHKGSGAAPLDYSFYAKVTYNNPENYDLEVCAVPFIVAGGHCYLLEEKVFSVVTLAQYHQTHGGTSLSSAALVTLAGNN